MPYLHWETDKRRREMAKVMKNVTQKHRKDLRKEFPHLNEQFREKFEESVEQARIKFGWRTPTEETTKKPKQEIREYSKLGTYLLEVAKVYEAMDIEPDVRILRDNLHPHNKNPPLHARRTLDQSYYWKLENTGKRDEDQVVYRGTKAGKSIYRTTRVVMVDQLWLYILDESKCPHHCVSKSLGNLTSCFRYNNQFLSSAVGTKQTRLFWSSQRDSSQSITPAPWRD